MPGHHAQYGAGMASAARMCEEEAQTDRCKGTQTEVRARDRLGSQSKQKRAERAWDGAEATWQGVLCVLG